jgi:hypothetical protein
VWAQNLSLESNNIEVVRPSPPVTTGSYPRGEPANRELVEAQLAHIQQHLDDSIRLVKTELGSQIDLLRRELNEMQSERQQRQQRGRDTKTAVLNIVGYAIASGIGALITWLLVGR